MQDRSERRVKINKEIDEFIRSLDKRLLPKTVKEKKFDQLSAYELYWFKQYKNYNLSENYSGPLTQVKEMLSELRNFQTIDESELDKVISQLDKEAEKIQLQNNKAVFIYAKEILENLKRLFSESNGFGTNVN